MKDGELRAIVLKWFYEHRREGLIMPDSEEFTPPIAMNDLYEICDQLGENGLLTWKPIRSLGGIHRAFAKINAPGIDAVELRWTPKVGQDGSLNQNQKNDPHVQEASSA